ncbi:hypothetical protein D3C72_1891220 [compost metagenome]
MPLDALAQRERIDGAVRADLPGGGQLRLRIQVVVVLEQAFCDLGADAQNGRGHVAHGDKRGRLGRQEQRQRAAARGLGMQGRGKAKQGAGQKQAKAGTSSDGRDGCGDRGQGLGVVQGQALDLVRG